MPWCQKLPVHRDETPRGEPRQVLVQLLAAEAKELRVVRVTWQTIPTRDQRIFDPILLNKSYMELKNNVFFCAVPDTIITSKTLAFQHRRRVVYMKYSR